jgi:hypothetical protein
LGVNPYRGFRLCSCLPNVFASNIVYCLEKSFDTIS